MTNIGSFRNDSDRPQMACLSAVNIIRTCIISTSTSDSTHPSLHRFPIDPIHLITASSTSLPSPCLYHRVSTLYSRWLPIGLTETICSGILWEATCEDLRVGMWEILMWRRFRREDNERMWLEQRYLLVAACIGWSLVLEYENRWAIACRKQIIGFFLSIWGGKVDILKTNKRYLAKPKSIAESC